MSIGLRSLTLLSSTILLVFTAAPAMAADASRWTVAGGIGLGSEYTALYEGRQNHNVNVTGYRPDEKREVTFPWILNGSASGDALPPLMREYRVKVFDDPIYLEGEAAGDGKLYVVFFRQKGDIDVEAAIAATIDRFGTPDQRSGGSMQWGSCSTGACADVDITPWRMEVRLQDMSAREAWTRTYEGGKSGNRDLAF